MFVRFVTTYLKIDLSSFIVLSGKIYPICFVCLPKLNPNGSHSLVLSLSPLSLFLGSEKQTSCLIQTVSQKQAKFISYIFGNCTSYIEKNIAVAVVFTLGARSFLTLLVHGNLQRIPWWRSPRIEQTHFRFCPKCQITIIFSLPVFTGFTRPITDHFGVNSTRDAIVQLGI